MGPEEPLSFPYPPQAVCSPKFTEPRTTYWKLVGARPAFGKQPVFAFLYHQMHKGNPVYLKAVLLSSSLPQTPKGYVEHLSLSLRALSLYSISPGNLLGGGEAEGATVTFVLF